MNNIYIGKREEFSKKISEVYSNKRVYIVTDNNVYERYKEEIPSIFKDYEYDIYIMQAGENNKNIYTAIEIYRDMIEKNISRDELVISLGGGVVGDIAGYVASTYMRGINFIQIPTSLLAQVDSSIGGKVGVNLDSYKNIVGAFYMPLATLIDTSFINTLPEYYYIDGMGEVIKAACIDDYDFFLSLKHNMDREEMIKKAISIKVKYVEKDIKESNTRMHLNYGHTIGHAIETYTEHKYSHGRAVAFGMLYMAKWGERLGITEAGTSDKVKEILEKYSLPIDINISMNDIFDIVKRDKKNREDGMNFIFLKKIGKSIIIKKEYDESIIKE